jgi:hypothetical protein
VCVRDHRSRNVDPVEGLIHRARLLTRARGARNGQGEYEDSDPPTPGPWFAARLMERGGPADKRRRGQTDARVPRGYELLTDTTATDGTAVVLTASSLVESECAILGSPTLELSGAPEKLTDGVEHIGWFAFAVKPGDAA